MVKPNPDPPVTPAGAERIPQFSNLLASRLDPQSRKGRANTAGMGLLLQALGQQEAVIREGGGGKAIEAQHGKKRLTARERLDLLLDPGSDFLELPAEDDYLVGCEPQVWGNGGQATICDRLGFS